MQYCDKKATFIVEMEFQHNQSWQGTLTWTNEGKVQRFRSAMEMLALMDSALAGEGTRVPPEESEG